MNPALLEEIAMVVHLDAEKIRDGYAWPPRPPMTDEERLEYDRLVSLSRRIWYRAQCVRYETNEHEPVPE